MAGDNTNFVYNPKMEQKANFIYNELYAIWESLKTHTSWRHYNGNRTH